MIRTEAPKDFEGRGLANLARTTPELPSLRALARSFRRLSGTRAVIMYRVVG